MYFYPRPPGGGRHAQKTPILILADISIHALRVEGDRSCRNITCSIHKFLSTPSGWRATACSRRSSYRESDFYPRPPGGGRPISPVVVSYAVNISIHALRVEGDVCVVVLFDRVYKFLSTPSGWRATQNMSYLHSYRSNFYPRPPGGGRHRRNHYGYARAPISIHALRVEGDTKHVIFAFVSIKFLSTPSGWRATPRNSV